MVNSSYLEYIVDQLAPIGPLTTARFFGGTGLSSEGVQFAMLMEGTLYFVVSDATRPKYEAMGSRCFSYSTKNGRVQVRRYFEVPAEVVEEQPRLVALARESMLAARASTKSKKRGAT